MFYKLANNYIFKFLTFLDNKGLSFNEGKIIDATFVEAPKQRNTKEENRQIKAGNGKDLWNPEEGDSEKEKKRKMHKKSHKDVDARWTKKRGENHYGYKNHIKADKKTKLIRALSVIDFEHLWSSRSDEHVNPARVGTVFQTAVPPAL